MNDKENEIQEELKKIEELIDLKKYEIKELRLKKYFLNQMLGKIEKLNLDYSKLIKKDEIENEE